MGKGSSRQAIIKYVMANNKVEQDAKKVSSRVKLALKKGLTSGALKNSKGTGVTGSFKLAEKPKVKKAKKPKAKKAAKPKKAKTPKKAAKKSPAKKAKKPAAKKAKCSQKIPRQEACSSEESKTSKEIARKK